MNTQLIWDKESLITKLKSYEVNDISYKKHLDYLLAQKALNSSLEYESPWKLEQFSGYTTDYDFYKKSKHYTNVAEALTWDIPKDNFRRTNASTSAYVKGSNWIEGKSQRETWLKDLIALKKKIEEDCDWIGRRSSAKDDVQTLENWLIKEGDG